MAGCLVSEGVECLKVFDIISGPDRWQRSGVPPAAGGKKNWAFFCERRLGYRDTVSLKINTQHTQVTRGYGAPGPSQVLLCFIHTDAGGISYSYPMIGYRGLVPYDDRVPRVAPGVTTSKPFPPYFRRWLRRALLFRTDHSRSPGTTVGGSEWGPASACPHQWVAPRGQGDPHVVLGG